MTWLYVVLAVVAVALAAWMYWTAERLDRMHHRIEVARGSLQTQLVHRSSTALELAGSEVLDPARSLLLLEAAHRARAADTEEFEAAESELSQVLRAVFADPAEVHELLADPLAGGLVTELADDCRKVELARRFHNDTAVTARELRNARRVRWFRLSGSAAAVTTVNLDDVPPPAFVAV